MFDLNLVDISMFYILWNAQIKIKNLSFALFLDQCVFVPGDSKGRDEQYLGKADTPEKCFEDVVSHDPPIPGVNGVTWGGGGTNCYAEIGATHVDTDKRSWKTCIFNRKF